MTIPTLCFGQADSERAYAEWGANCGPTALAAILSLTLDEVRPHLGDFDKRRYMSYPMMREALESLGVAWMALPTPPRVPLPFPDRGLVRIQWSGPWCRPGVHPGAAASHTHWIASALNGDQPWVFDVNGGWRPRESWVEEVVPLLLESIKRSDGTWFATHRWELKP